VITPFSTSVDDLSAPPLTQEEKERAIARIRQGRSELLSGGLRMMFHKAFDHVASMWTFELMLHDPHVPGNGIACTVTGLAAYLMRKHIDEKAEEIVEEEEEEYSPDM